MARRHTRQERAWRFRLDDETTLEVRAQEPSSSGRARAVGRWSLMLVTVFAAGLVASGVVSGAGPLGMFSEPTSTETSTDQTSTESTEDDSTETTDTEPTEPEPTESEPTESEPTESTPTPSGPPTIASDKEDYAPGELVTLTGTNWQPGEVVNIDVNDDQGQTWRRNVDVVASEDGEIVDRFNLPDWFVATYQVTATGAVSGVARASFTDGNVQVRTNTGGPTVTLTYTRFSATSCSGTVVAGPTDVTISPTSGSTILFGQSTGSFRLQVPDAAGTQVFDEWTSMGNFSSSDNPLCFDAISGNRTFTATYISAPTFNVTFEASGLPTGAGSDAVGTVLAVGATSYTASQLPVTLSLTSGSTVTYAYSTPVSSTTAGKQYVHTGTTGPASGFTVTANTTVTGNYGTQYQLSLATDPPAVGSGAISGASDGDWFDSGASVSLTAASPVVFNAGESRYVFSSWSGDATGSSNPVSVTMDAPKSVTANYLTQHRLTLTTAPETGIGGPDNPAASPSSTDGFYDEGESVSITAEDPVAIDAGSRWRFEEWTGAASGTDNPVTVTMDSPKSVTASYVKQFELTLDTAPVSGIGGPDNPAASPSATDGFYDSGTLVAITAEDPVAIDAGSRWRFEEWTGDASGTDNPVSVTMDAPKSVTAEYVKQFEVTFTQSGIGTDTGANTVGTIGGSAKSAGDLPVTDWFDEGTAWSFEELVETSPASGKRYVLTSASSGTVTAAGTITGAYGTQFQLSLATDPAAVGVSNITGASDGDWFDAGDTVELTAATPVAIDDTSRYRFEEWTGDASGTDNPVSVTMDSPRSVTASYVLQYLLTFAQSGIALDTGTNTVVTVDGAAKAKSALPLMKWYDEGATATYVYSSPVFTSPASATQYTLTGVTGPDSPITVDGPATITGTYAASVFTIKYLRPLEQTTDGSVINTGKNGRVIPVKIELFKDGVKLDASTIPGDVTMRVVGANCAPSTSADPVEEYADAGASNGNTNLFRWTSEGLIYNLDTKALGLQVNKCYRLDVYIGGLGAIRASASTYALFKPVK